jgi:hypothetical protein
MYCDYAIECNIVHTPISRIAEFEYSKRVFRSRKSKKDRQYNGLKKKDKQRSTKNTQKTNGRATRTPLTTGVNPCAPEG